jgi:hypothetical protein
LPFRKHYLEALEEAYTPKQGNRGRRPARLQLISRGTTDLDAGRIESTITSHDAARTEWRLSYLKEEWELAAGALITE